MMLLAHRCLSWGVGAGFFRGCLEAFLLYYRYPSRPGIGSLLKLSVTCGLGYACAIGIGSLFVGYVADRIARGKIDHLLSFCFLPILLGIDVIGWHTPGIPGFHRFLWPESAPSAGRDDVLLITIDTCRADHLPFYGYQEVYVPVMESLAQRGTVFENAVTSIPVTTSSHASILTGKNPAGHGSRFNAVPIEQRVNTLAEVLQQEGYWTAAFVSAFPVVHDVSNLGKGFMYYDQLLAPRTLEPLFYRSTLIKPMTHWSRFRLSERPAWQTTDSVLSWWKRNPGSPRFTWVHYYDPHAPYDPPKIHREMGMRSMESSQELDGSISAILAMNQSHERPSEGVAQEMIARYDGEIGLVDESIGRLIEALLWEGRLDHTLIVITADHGESLLEHDYYFSHGDNVYDPSIRVPLILYHSRRIPGNRIVRSQVGTVDIMPTILAQLDISGDDPFVDGTDLSAEMLHFQKLPGRSYFSESGFGVYIQAHAAPDENIRKKDRCIRKLNEKLVFTREGQHIWFDLDSDPGECSGIIDKTNERSIHLATELHHYIISSETPNRRPAKVLDLDTIRQLESLGYVQSE